MQNQPITKAELAACEQAFESLAKERSYEQAVAHMSHAYRHTDNDPRRNRIWRAFCARGGAKVSGKAGVGDGTRLVDPRDTAAARRHARLHQETAAAPAPSIARL